MDDTKRYETKRYEMENFWLDEGWYSIKDLEAILKEMRRQSQGFDEALQRAMKEKNT
jgi:hypothetical protein